MLDVRKMTEIEKRAQHKEYAVICSRCGAVAPWALSKQEARELAEESGWQLVEYGPPLCPECAGDLLGFSSPTYG
jgi:Fe2+ or Zn2+ uptake regulation protein